MHGAVDLAHLDEAVADAQRRLDRVVQPLAQVVLDDEAVDDGRDVVLELLVERRHLLEQVRLAVDAHAREALAAQALEHVAVLALAAAHERRVDREARALGQRQHLIDDLLGGLAGDRPPADRAVRPPDAREQQAQVVVHLGDRADGRARVLRRRLLVDRDRGREPLDRVDVGLVHLPQELARVGRERLDVAALALGVERVERERRLARSGQPRDAHEPPARQAHGHVAQVVLARSVDDDFVVEKAVLQSCGPSRLGQPSSGLESRTSVRIIGAGQDAAHRRRSTSFVCRARARNSSPASACCSRRGRTRPLCCPRSCARSASCSPSRSCSPCSPQSSAPDPVRIALDLLALAFACRHRPPLRARGVAVGPLALRAHHPPRLRGRPARRRAPRLGDDAARRDPHRRRRPQLRAGSLFGYATLTLGDGPRGRDVRFVSDAERVAAGDPRREPRTDAPGRRSRGRLSLNSRPLVRASRDRGRDQAGSSIV